MPVVTAKILSEADVSRLPVLVRKHIHRASVAAAMGVMNSTLFRWLKAGREIVRRVERNPDVPIELTPREHILYEFYRVMVQSEAELEAELIEAARADNPALILERWRPARWGRWRGVEAELRRDIRELVKRANVAQAAEVS